MNKALLHLVHFVQRKKHTEGEQGFRRALKLYNAHFKKAFFKKQAPTWGLCLGSQDDLPQQRYTSLFPQRFSTLQAQSMMGAEESLSISQPIFLSYHWDAALSPEHQWFYQLVAKLDAETSRSRWKLWDVQDPVQPQNNQITTYSHASCRMQQQSACTAHTTCKTTSFVSTAAKSHHLLLAWHWAHTTHHQSTADPYLAARECEPPAKDDQKAIKRPQSSRVARRRAGMPLPSISRDYSCCVMQQAQQRQPEKSKKPAEFPKSVWIYPFRALIQVMNRLWSCLASMNCQRLQNREQHS